MTNGRICSTFIVFVRFTNAPPVTFIVIVIIVIETVIEIVIVKMALNSPRLGAAGPARKAGVRDGLGYLEIMLNVCIYIYIYMYVYIIHVCTLYVIIDICIYVYLLKGSSGRAGRGMAAADGVAAPRVLRRPRRGRYL